MQQGIDWLLTAVSDHPLLLEVFTEATEDEQSLRTYYQELSDRYSQHSNSFSNSGN